MIEDVEIYSPKLCTQSSKVGFIAYLLRATSFFDQKISTNTMEGNYLELKLNKDGSMSTKKNIIKLNFCIPTR